METKDIKLPLRYSSHRQIMDAAGNVVIEVWSGGSGTAAADQLQQLVPVACNSHALLVEALVGARELLALNGITSSDTADYGNGRADDIIGRIDAALLAARVA